MGLVTYVVEQRWDDLGWHSIDYAVEPCKLAHAPIAFAGYRREPHHGEPLIVPRGIPVDREGFDEGRSEPMIPELIHQCVTRSGRELYVGDYGPTGWLEPMEALWCYRWQGFAPDGWLIDLLETATTKPRRLIFGFE